MNPALTRTLCLSAFALLLLQGALLNCVACGHSLEAAVEQLDCASCHDHEEPRSTPCHHCEMHRQVQVLHPSRAQVPSFTSSDFVPAPHPLEILARQSAIALLTPHYTSPPDPGWRDVGIIIIRC